jgi:hypothetical protein
MEEEKKRQEELWQRYQQKRAANEENALRMGAKSVQGAGTPADPSQRLGQAEYDEEFTVSGGKVGTTLKKSDNLGMTPYQLESLRLQNERLNLDRNKVGNKPTTKAQQAVDRSFGNEYQRYVASGGYADTIQQIDTMEGVHKDLSGGKKNLTGPIKSLVPQRFRPESTAAQQAVEQSVQRSLKQTLGGQFTEREGTMFMQRGYDPRLPEEENAKKLRRAINQLKTMATAKQRAVDYYEENGTLDGFRGEFYTMRDGEMIKATKDDFYRMMQGAPEGDEPEVSPVQEDEGIGWSDAEEQELRALEAEFGG